MSSWCRALIPIWGLVFAAAGWGDSQGKIAFAALRNFQWDIFTVNADGTGLTTLTNTPDFDLSPAWSPDGAHIAYQTLVGDQGTVTWDIFVVDADGGLPRNLTGDPFQDLNTEPERSRSPTTAAGISLPRPGHRTGDISPTVRRLRRWSAAV